jgi:hypothetical protein
MYDIAFWAKWDVGARKGKRKQGSPLLLVPAVGLFLACCSPTRLLEA